MEKQLFDDLMESVQQAIDYERGDKTRARSVYVEIEDEEIIRNHAFMQDFYKLPEPSKVKAINYVAELLDAATG